MLLSFRALNKNWASNFGGTDRSLFLYILVYIHINEYFEKILRGGKNDI